MGALLIDHGTVIDGTGAAPVPDTAVLIDGDEIIAVGADAVAAASADATRIDATGLTVMPGLIDSHCHATFDDVQSNDELFFHREPFRTTLLAAFNMPKFLMAGVTSIMDPDTAHGMGPALRDAIEAGVVEGPRMATGVQALLTSVGGTAGRLIPDDGQAGYAQVVNTRDEMITWTRRHIKQGADWIKIHATGSIPTRPGELQVWSYEELKAVCDTAHELDVPVTAHCRNASSTLDSARAGVDLILHASFMDEPGLDAIVEAGAAICPTFTFLANLADYGPAVGAGVGMRDIFRGEIEATSAILRKAHELGVPLLCGSESGFALTPYGHWHARELEVFVRDLDLTPLEAITCATANNAMAMRLEGRLGTIETGRLADVIVVDGDPSTDVTLLQDRSNLRHVISRGRAVDLDRPWPSRDRMAGEKVANWADEILTWDRAQQ